MRHKAHWHGRPYIDLNAPGQPDAQLNAAPLLRCKDGHPACQARYGYVCYGPCLPSSRDIHLQAMIITWTRCYKLASNLQALLDTSSKIITREAERCSGQSLSKRLM